MLLPSVQLLMVKGWHLCTKCALIYWANLKNCPIHWKWKMLDSLEPALLYCFGLKLKLDVLISRNSCRQWIYKKPTKWLDEICNKLINQYKHQNFILKTDILYYQHPSWHFYHSLQITPLKFKKRKKVVLGEAGQSSKSLEAAGSRW